MEFDRIFTNGYISRMNSDFLSVEQAAKRKKLSEESIRYHARKGHLPSVRFGKKNFMFKPEDVDAFTPGKPGNPGKPGRTLRKIRFGDPQWDEFQSELALEDVPQDDAVAEAIQDWIDKKRRQRRKKK